MRQLKICLASSECTPFAKTGGLADVVGALGRFLARRGHDVRIVLPMYLRIKHGGHELVPVEQAQDVAVHLGGRKYWFSVSTLQLPRSPAKVWLVRCPELYEREGIYTQDADEHLRFALLSRAAFAIAQQTQWSPDVLHCNDWHTALIPLYLRTHYSWDKLFARTRTVLTIHNIAYQGMFGADVIPGLGLDGERHLLWQEDLGENRINFLKTGLLYADAITTVSRTYAKEIQTDAHGMGLAGLLRQRADAVMGIVNGVDYEDWDPATDPWIAANYKKDDLAGKAACKRALLAQVGLPHDPAAPVFGIVSRLTWQKGFELLAEVLTVLLQRGDLRLVVLGTGEEKYENYFRWLQQTFPAKVAYERAYQEELAHRIEAGADLLLMPSRFEPCGLNQMYSLKYGTVPIVHKVGGLADTVEPWSPTTRTGTGFVFTQFTPEALLQAIRDAQECWNDRQAWRVLQRNGMERDFSWDHQAEEYAALYKKLVPPEQRQEPGIAHLAPGGDGQVTIPAAGPRIDRVAAAVEKPQRATGAKKPRKK
jgi:starch synthase